jgi:hypothetical protein
MRSTLLQALLATALTAGLYSAALDRVPPYLLHDEIRGALQARSIAESGRDLNGRWLPLYFQEQGFSVGRDPVAIYLTALVLEVLPLSEGAIRLPSALVGSLGVGLTLVLARLWLPGTWLPWLAAGTLALTPGYFIHSRLGHQVIYTVPFAVAWLVCVTLYLKQPRPRYAFAAGAVLGLGVYSYLAALITMPTYLAATLAVMLLRRDGRGARAVVVGWAIALAPLVLWQFVQPDRYADMLSAYRLVDQEAGAATRPGLRAAMGALQLRLDTLWDAFNPSRLFFSGESSLNVSTRRAGILLLPVAPLLVAGLIRLGHTRRTPQGLLLLCALAMAPLPAVVMADVEIRRWLVALPWAALIAACGAQALLEGGRLSRAAAVLLLLLLPVQFSGFVRDYFTDYPARAGLWFGGNIRGAVTTALGLGGTDPPPAVYLDSRIPYIDDYWRFYATVHGHEGLIARAIYVPQAAMAEYAPAGAVFVTRHGTALAEDLAAAGWTGAATIREPDGAPSFIVHVRAGAP